MSLKTYTLPELHKLNARITREIARRDTQTRAAVLKRLTKLAAEAGLELDDVLQTSAAPQAARKAAPRSAAPKAKAAPKYRHPSDSSLIWSGRGRKPMWVEAWLGTGRALESLAIAATR